MRVPLIEDIMDDSDSQLTEENEEAENIPQVKLFDEPRTLEKAGETSPPKLTIVRPFDQRQEQFRAGKLAASGQFDLEVRTLAGGRVWNNEHEIEHWRMGKARELFFFLLEHGKCSRDELVEALWPDADFASAPNLFHFTMSSLRKVIKPADVKLASQRYSLVGEIWHDADELKRQVKYAQSSVQLNVAELTAALDLYQRDYLDLIYSDWATYRRQEILQSYLDGLSLLAHHFEAQNQIGQAANLWRRYLLKDSYSEEAHRSLINCYIALGNKKEARQQYAECMRMLEEVDAKPTLQTQSLIQKLA
jgi:two-component SAPR family response regulator